MIAEIRSARDRLDFQYKLVQGEFDKVDVRLQNVFSNQLALKSAGLVEKSVQYVLNEYARRRSNETIANFVLKQVSWENSLNCEKISKLLDRFDRGWWPEVESSTSEESRLAVDSLKTIRDQIAHGGENGTGMVTIIRYHQASLQFVDGLLSVVLPE
ncbi:HEPN domain-containing protein [Devosia sp.]|uniref:HEPN domain-containing protein n=1 Tax=Devosia sp. TaxID=1871048 RepID=UPI0034576578